MRHVLEASGLSTDPDFMGFTQTAAAALLPRLPLRATRDVSKSTVSGKAEVWSFTLSSSRHSTLVGDYEVQSNQYMGIDWSLKLQKYSIAAKSTGSGNRRPRLVGWFCHLLGDCEQGSGLSVPHFSHL